MNSLNENKKRAIISGMVAVGINILLFVLVLKLNNCLFASNDDMSMRDITAGAYTGIPDGHLVYMKYALGGLISMLYGAFATVPWYSIALYASMFLSFCLLLYKLLFLAKNTKMIVLNSLCFAFFVLVLYKYLVYPQYTVVAGIVGATAVFWYFTQQRTPPKKEFVADTVIVVFLCTLSYMIRQDVFFICAAMLVVGLVIKLIVYKKEYVKRAVILVIALMLCLGSVFVVEKVAYKDYQEYLEFNEARSSVYDYYGVPPYEMNEELYKEIGIDYSTYLNIVDYATQVGDDINAGTLGALAKSNDVAYKQQTELSAQLKNAFSPYVDMFFNAYFVNVITLCALMFLAVAFFASILNKKKMKIWLLALDTVVLALLAFYIAFNGRMIERVTMIFLIVSLMVSFAMIATNEKYYLPFCKKCRMQKVISWVLSIAFFVFVGMVFVQVLNKNKAVMASEGAFLNGRFRARQAVEEYVQENPQSLYYSSVYVLTNYTDKVLTHNDTQFSNNAYAGGWLAESPMDNARLEKLGMTKDFAEGLVSQPQALYMAPPDIMASMKAYIEQHYENKTLKQIDMIETTDINGAPVYYFGVYQVVDALQYEAQIKK